MYPLLVTLKTSIISNISGALPFFFHHVVFHLLLFWSFCFLAYSIAFFFPGPCFHVLNFGCFLDGFSFILSNELYPEYYLVLIFRFFCQFFPNLMLFLLPFLWRWWPAFLPTTMWFFTSCYFGLACLITFCLYDYSIVFFCLLSMFSHLEFRWFPWLFCCLFHQIVLTTEYFLLFSSHVMFGLCLPWFYRSIVSLHCFLYSCISITILGLSRVLKLLLIY